MKIFIIDDHQLFRMGIRLMFAVKQDMDVIGEAASGKEAFAFLENHTPDIILLDNILPDTSGIEIARRLKKEKPEIKILMLSAEKPEHIIEQILEIGIEGFVTKTSDIQEVEKAVVSVMNGLEYFGRDISKIIHDVVVLKKQRKEKTHPFTSRELEIVRLCSEGLLSKEIADRLQISHRTVENHKNNIFKKLGINNSIELIRYSIQHGILN